LNPSGVIINLGIVIEFFRHKVSYSGSMVMLTV